MGSQAEQTSFLFAHNASFIGDLFARYREDPTSVDESWRSFFGSLGTEAQEALSDVTGPSWSQPQNGAADLSPDTAPYADAFELTAALPPPAKGAKKGNGAAAPAEGASHEQLVQATMDSIRALMLVRAYRVRGHLEAQLDPLGLEKREHHPELDPKTYGFTEADMDRPIYLNMVLGFERASLRQVMERLRATYCGHIGVEYLHIQDPEQKAWIQERIESAENRTDFTERGRRAILDRLTASEIFEKFLHLKYTGTKRFGLDGAESLVPAIEQVMKRGGQLGLQEIVIGMSHRGRLNILANVMGKPFAAIFSEFQGNPASPEDVQGSGDVKYHLGTSSDRDFDGSTIHLSLTANPSHLEAVNPVVVGKVRAKQAQQKDTEREKVMGLLLHGDAAFPGQGVVPETLMLSELKGYRIGGTVHFIVNNQIGFTTSPKFGRSSPYPTDVAKGIQAPILHVNGDDPEAVVHASRIAIEFRQRFKKDVVVDVVCYRRFGHNEGDEPAFTQPLMYKTIAGMPTTRQVYAERLEAEGVLEKGEGERLAEEFQQKLEKEYEASSSYKPNKADWLGGAWEGLSIATGEERRGRTAVAEKTLREVGRAITHVPETFNANSKIVRQLKAKAKAIDEGKGIDWPLAEALAFGTLCHEGFPVRLSGQDSGRGTFSQRHSVLIDQDTEKKYVPLNNVAPGQAAFEVHDSPLSEFAVMGFEYGYSLAEPKALTLWEAQFGDFCNGAQIIIDQFLSSGEQKWLRMSGLVLLLPHGYEGQGPEHSSARLERFLNQSAEDNWQVIYPTTPANYFHALRRQLHRDFRKPLIVMTPKSMLRQKYFVSDIEEFVGNSTFHRVLFENGRDKQDKSVKRVVLCTGKVYYDLLQERDARKLNDITLVRLEQLYPFPEKALSEEVEKYPNADVVWCQEEPANMGAWYFADRRIEAMLEKIGHKAKRPKYAGRPEAASPATGVVRWHQREQAALIDQALTIDGS
ncbi:2-oxoglutarate dehydrogenase E1 component [Fodinicurvata sp. EGI_FJ10296]|uniref:2-oxoglutarate dehydrogenase E1 component n=1 Tax=Fodinicurvata sp. EGI_FJ10296 TaxID=3231908 RepID=UPI003453D9C7